MKKIATLFLLSLCTPLMNTQSGASSTYGQEIYVGFMRDVGGGFFTQLRLVVGTPGPSMNVSFKVESKRSVLFEGTTSPDNPAIVNIPVNYLVTHEGYSEREKGIRVYTSNNELIFIILETFISFLNHGVYMAYPCVAFEEQNEYEYYALSIDDPSDSTRSQILLIACEDDTSITVVPTQTVTLPEDAQSSMSMDININAGTPSHQLTLHQMQTLLVSSFDDLSRTKIISNKPMVVISGHECAAVPSTAFGCEPFSVQIPPTITWGSNFFVAPFAGRIGFQNLKAVSSKENSSFIITCGTSSRGATSISILDIFVDEYCYIESSDPIFLAQFSFDGSLDNMGDPAFAIVPPVDQYLNEIKFLSLPSINFPINRISITLPVEYFTHDQILLDSTAVNCDWQKIFNSTDGIVGYGCNVTVSSRQSTHTLHTVSHLDPNGMLSVLAYGFATFPERGYAYLTGQQIKIADSISGGEDFDFGDIEDFPLIDLTIFPGVKELPNVEVDSSSEAINIPNGLFFGSDFQTSAYVNENGVISFEEPWKFSHPDQFPTDYYYSRNKLVVAPFWSDNDIRKAGAVRYATYDSNEGDDNPNGQELLNQVNKYIQNSIEEGSENFTGNWMLAVHWDHVHPSPHGAEDHSGISESELEKTNNYQAIIVTDTFRTYAVFIYKCGDIQWSGLNQNQGAVIGFDAEGNYYGNHPLSGFSSIGQAVSCTFDINKRRKRNTQQSGAQLCGLNSDQGDVRIDSGTQCRAFGLSDVSLFENLFGASHEADLITFVDMFGPCPSTKSHADDDLGRYIEQPSNTLPDVDCYVSGKPIVMESLNLTQQCCYATEDGSLVADDMQRAMSGTLLISHPIRNRERYINGDKLFRDTCCPEATGNNGRFLNIFCQQFYFRRRPVLMSEEMYIPPDLGTAHGDPHYATFDGRKYDFNGMGDFLLLDIRTPEGDSYEFRLQGRLDRVSFWRVTTHQALAFGQPGLTFHFGMGPGDGFRIFQTNSDEDIEITNEIRQLNGEQWFDSTGRASLAMTGNNCHESYRDTYTPLTAAFYDSGILLVACVYKRGSEHYINFRIHIPRSPYHQSGRIRGFFGDYDSNPTNEFYEMDNNIAEVDNFGRDGMELFNLLKTWEILNQNEKFFYKNMEGVTGGVRKRQVSDFIPIFYDDLTFTDEQRAVCDNDEPCLFDLAVTSDMAFASNTLDQEKVANSTKAILSNFPPNISGNSTFQLTVGVISEFLLTVEDEGDFLFTVQGGLPENSLLEKVGDGVFRFSWNLQQVTNRPLIFVANDSLGASSIFVPNVEICACENGGICTSVNLPTINTTNVNIKKCSCDEAFDGDFCEEDKNGCSEIQCFEGVECLDIPAPGVGAVCGICATGFTGDGLKCYDINECALNKTLCDQICNNTDGGYYCNCNEGYQLIEGSNQCEDINECEGINDCQQECVNIEGSYNCSCMEGFNLADDGRNCTAKALCENDKGKCSGNALCAVIDDEEICFCPLGFQLSTPGGIECNDINECLLDNMPCRQICNNSEGSFECTCLDGYQLQDDGHTCSDINECLVAAMESINLCESNQNTQCINNIGSYDCVCVPGYSIVNGSCQRIPEEPPPPPPPVVTPTTGIDNSLNYTTLAFTQETFTPGRQQQFRKITAQLVVQFCSMTVCTVVQLDGKLQEITDLKIEAMNVAIPVALIGTNDEGQLEFTFYIQLPDGFLFKGHLQQAVEQGEDVYRDAFYIVTTTSPPTMEASTATTQPPITTAETTTKPPTNAATTTVASTPSIASTTEISTEPSTSADATTVASVTTEISTEPSTSAGTTPFSTTKTSTRPSTTEAIEQTTTTISTTEPKIVTPAKEICYMPSDPGPCQEYSSRYYFNVNTGVCEEFMYGGCEGNGNNFATLDECSRLCNPNDCPPFCTHDYCNARATRRSVCTIFNPEDLDCEAYCRITTCRVCYYDDEYHPLALLGCDTCPTYPDVHNIHRCFNKWGTCVRRTNAELYPKVRGRDKTPDRFKCYEHPCN